jgi:hypothetical protein
MSHLRRITAIVASVAGLGVGVASGAAAQAPVTLAGTVAHRATVPPTPAVARTLAAALARHGFPASKYRLAHTAVSVNPSGYAITTPVARNPLDQGNGVVIFARVRGRWRAVADGSSFTHVSGVPAAVLAALLHVPHEGSV